MNGSQVKSRDQLSSSRVALRKLRVPLKSPGDAGGMPSARFPPIREVCTRRPTLGMPPSGNKDDDTPGSHPSRYQGRDEWGVRSSGAHPPYLSRGETGLLLGWPAYRRTVWVGQGSGYALKDASPPMGITRCPPSQYAVPGSTRSSPVRTAAGGRSRTVTSPTVLPSNSAKQPYARGGVVDRIPQVTPDSPRPSPVSPPLPRESPRDGRVRGPFHSTASALAV